MAFGGLFSLEKDEHQTHCGVQANITQSEYYAHSRVPWGFSKCAVCPPLQRGQLLGQPGARLYPALYVTIQLKAEFFSHSFTHYLQ